MYIFSLLTSSDIEKVLAFDEYFQIYPPRRQELERGVADNACYLMKSNNQIVGYGVFRPYGLVEEGFIHLLVIDRKYRGNGYATEFMKYFESLAKTKRIHISVNTSNIPMQNLVKKLGYQEGGRLKSFDENDPEIFFYKQLE